MNIVNKIDFANIKETNKLIKLFESLNGSVFKIVGFEDSKVSFEIGENEKEKCVLTISTFYKVIESFFIYSYHFNKHIIEGSFFTPDYEEDKEKVDSLFTKKFRLSKIKVNSSELTLFFVIENNYLFNVDNNVVFTIFDTKCVELGNCQQTNEN